MLFNSYEFLFLYLPVTLGVVALARGWAVPWLTLCSFFFYAYWDVAALPLLVLSIAFNYFIGNAIVQNLAVGRARAASHVLAFGVTVDLLVLGWFKYVGLAASSLQFLIGWPHQIPQVALPIGISFFTFTQIAFLVDARYRAISQSGPMKYALFVSYFPHLVAGPIIHHAQVVPQFSRPGAFRITPERLAVGATIFTIGLVKKVLFADSLQPYVAEVFDVAALQPTFFEAWIAVLAFTFQLYFDFSGYSDMAIGLSCLFGIWLPLNFASPYKAASIIEFWRCWHMSLSRFLRDYLYIPLGGSRSGLGRYLNILITMVLGGLWHGANWTFVLWGGLHGFYLLINHAWRAWRGPGQHSGILSRAAGWFLTFLAVVVGWVFFRAINVDDAFRILAGMSGLNGFAVPPDLAQLMALFHPGLATTLGLVVKPIPALAAASPLILLCLAICLLAPNSQQIVGRYLRTEEKILPATGCARHVRWRPNAGWAFATALLFAVSLTMMTGSGEFLYFQF